MKLTTTQLRRIIKEEVQKMVEADPGYGDAGLDVSGPEVEMMSGRSSFVIELGDSSKEAVDLFRKAAAWCASAKRPIDYSAANSIEIGTEEDGVTIDFVPNPQQMAASFNAAADFIAQNSKELIHVDID